MTPPNTPPTPSPQTSPPQPDALPFDASRVEPFQIIGANLIEATPDEDPGLPAPHIKLVLVGQPVWAQEPKTYLTAISPKLAIDIGRGLIDLGESMGGAAPSVHAASVEDMRAATKGADILRDVIQRP